MENDNRITEYAHKDAFMIEYSRHDLALRNYLKFSFSRHPLAIINEPSLLFAYVEVLNDVWDEFRPFFHGESEQIIIDKDVEELENEAFDLYNAIMTEKMNNQGVPMPLFEKIRAFFSKGRDIYRRIRVLRQLKGLGLRMKKKITDEERGQYIAMYAGAVEKEED